MAARRRASSVPVTKQRPHERHQGREADDQTDEDAECLLHDSTISLIGYLIHIQL